MIARGSLINRQLQLLLVLAATGLLFVLATCGGGGGSKKVTVTGVVDDGGGNSSVPTCRFVDKTTGKKLSADRSDQGGGFQLLVDPGVEGYIYCGPESMANLNLTTFSSTVGYSAGQTKSEENVTPTTTVVADIIRYEKPPDPEARKAQLMLEAQTDPDLRLVISLAGRLYRAMLAEDINASFGNDRGDGGDPDPGGSDSDCGVGGDAGDGADFSPLQSAECTFMVGNDFGNADSIPLAALADLLDGELERPDLKDLAGEVFEGMTESPEEIQRAFEAWFGEKGLGEVLADRTNDAGEYFLPIPPNVAGYVRCVPLNRQNLVLGTYIPGRAVGEKLIDEVVNPATTVFSAIVAPKLEEDLKTVKENYLSDIEGLEVLLDWPDYPQGTLDGFTARTGSATNSEVGLVAFSATALFNIFYKNELDADFPAAIADLVDNVAENPENPVDPAFIEAQGIPAAKAQELAGKVNDSIGRAEGDLDTDLATALSTARVHVTVMNAEGLVPDAEVTIVFNGVIYSDVTGDSGDNEGQVTLTLSGVPQEATTIVVTVSAVSGYDMVNKDIEVVAFATVDLDFNLELDTPQPFELGIQGSGDGMGAIVSRPRGISCGVNGGAGDTCTAPFASGTQVTLTATPEDGSTFGGWGGACSGTDPCMVTMDQARTVTATFTLIVPEEYRLTVTKSGDGSGTVSSNPGGISCGTSCTQDTHDYEDGTRVTLTAAPQDGSTFDGWSGGGCSGTGPCTVTMNQAHTVTATFNGPLAGQRLIVNKAGGGRGRVTSVPSGINCDPSCAQTYYDYEDGTRVTLTAAPQDGSTFDGWSGGACSGTGTCTVTMDRARTVTATFTPITPVISGTVRTTEGTTISGVTVTFSNNGGTATTNSSGAYSRTESYGWSGTATPSRSGWTFDPGSREYTNVTTNRANQDYAGCAAPSTPGSISYPSSDDDGSFTVSWPSASGATSYRLQRATNASFTGATTVYTGSSTSYSQTGLGTGTYYYRVRAENDCGDSGYRTGGAISVCIVPSRPGSISYPASDCDGSFTVDWPSVSGASYRLQRATNDSFSNAITVYTGSSSSYDEPELGTGTYYYRVRAENGCGDSSYRTGGAITVSTAPSRPGSIDYPSSDYDGNFTVDWPSISGATRYRLQRATNYYFDGATTVYTGSSSSYNQTGLGPGTYYYRVRAENDCGESSYREGSGVVVEPTTDVTGTWSLQYDWDCDGNDGSVTWDISGGPTSGTFTSSGDYSGTWSLNGSEITLRYTQYPNSIYTGTVSGDQMSSGTMVNDLEMTGCWSASRGGIILLFGDSINIGESSADDAGNPPSP